MILHTPVFPLLIPAGGGEPIEIKPENGTDFRLKELYRHIGCELIEVAHSQATGKTGAERRNHILIIDEEGKMNGKLGNPAASEWYSHPHDIIVGNAILCHSDYLK
jgi:hypothetical protein